jgi:hypothetical protein
VVRCAQRLGRSARTSWQSRPRITAAVGTVAATLVVLQAALVWPDAFAAALRQHRIGPPTGLHAEIADSAESETALQTATNAPPATAPPLPPTSIGPPESGRTRSSAGDRSGETTTPAPVGMSPATAAGAATTGPVTSAVSAPAAPAPGRSGGSRRSDGGQATSSTTVTAPPASNATTTVPDAAPSSLADLFAPLFPGQ